MMLRIIGLFVLLAAGRVEVRGLTNSSAVRNDWVARSWRTIDGLPQNNVNALVQTKDGYLWIGTSGGLARFDGVRFRTFGLADGLRSVQVMSLHEDRAGKLWVGTVGGGVSRWDDGRFTTYAEAEGFPPANAQAMAADRDGTLWVGSERGLTRLRDGRFQSVGATEGLPEKQVRALLLDSQGVLWVSVLPDGLYRGTNGQFARVSGVNGVPAETYCLTEDNEGNIWAGAGTGRLWRWGKGVWTSFGPKKGGVPNGNVMSLAQRQGSALWLGVRSRGIGFLKEGVFHDVTSEAKLSNESVTAVMLDREGVVWAGTASAGLIRISRRVLSTWGVSQGLPLGTVTSVAESPRGVLWTCTPNNGIHLFREGSFTNLQDSAVSGNFPFTYAAEMTADGSVWVAGEQCLFRFRTGEKTEAFHAPPIKNEAIRALCADGTNLWLGTYYSTLLKAEGTNITVVATNGSFSGGINSIVREAPETLWIGTSGGLYRWERGSVKAWGVDDGLPGRNVRALHREGNGTLWIGTVGGGLARLKDGRIVNVTSRHGLVDDVISQIISDDFGYLWLGCNRGLMRLEKNELNAFLDGRLPSVHPVVLGEGEGMLREQCSGGHSPTALKTKNGHLLFPTSGGIVEVDPCRVDELTPIMPEPMIEEVLIDDRPQSKEKPLVVSPGNHRIEFIYTAPILLGERLIRFRTRLEGLDKDWGPPGSRRAVSYAGLRPGHYTFHIAASNSRGVWNTRTASLSIVVKPRFWQTAWFGMSLAGGLMGSVVVFYRRRLKHVEARRRAQEDSARRLISAQENERARLARELHDDITQRLALLAIDAGRAEKDDSETGGKPPGLLRKVRDGLVRLSEDVHALSYKLHPSLLDDLGLTEALRAECDRFARHESLHCEASLCDSPANLGRETALALFRITQEALRNISRHARATHVNVTLRQLEGGLQLAIRDNGVGFEPARRRDRLSLGLPGMRERAHLLGGELDVESAPGTGTTVVAWIPIHG